jgi:hypothetical protein
VKPTQPTVCITGPLQHALRQAANEPSGASDYARRALAKMLRAEGYYIPAATHSADGERRGSA